MSEWSEPDEAQLHADGNRHAAELYELLQSAPCTRELTRLGMIMLLSTLVDDLVTPEAPLAVVLEAVRRGALHARASRDADERKEKT